LEVCTKTKTHNEHAGAIAGYYARWVTCTIFLFGVVKKIIIEPIQWHYETSNLILSCCNSTGSERVSSRIHAIISLTTTAFVSEAFWHPDIQK
jgi:hypothetical protein